MPYLVGLTWFATLLAVATRRRIAGWGGAAVRYRLAGGRHWSILCRPASGPGLDGDVRAAPGCMVGSTSCGSHCKPSPEYWTCRCPCTRPETVCVEGW